MKKCLALLGFLSASLVQVGNAHAAAPGPYPYSQLKDCDAMIINAISLQQFQDILNNTPNTNGGDLKICLAGEHGHVLGGTAPDLTQITITRDNTVITGEPARTAYDNKNSITVSGYNYPDIKALPGSVVVVKNAKNVSLQSLHLASDRPNSTTISVSDGASINLFDELDLRMVGRGGKSIGLYGTKEKPIKAKKISRTFIHYSPFAPKTSDISHGMQLFDAVVDDIEATNVHVSYSPQVGIQTYNSIVGRIKGFEMYDTPATANISGTAIESSGSVIQLIDGAKFGGEVGINLMKTSVKASRVGIIQNSNLKSRKYGVLVQQGSTVSAVNNLTAESSNNAGFGVTLSGAGSIGSIDYLQNSSHISASGLGTALLVIEGSKIGTISNFALNNSAAARPVIVTHTGTIETLYNGVLNFSGANAISENTGGSIKEKVNVVQQAS